MPFEKGISGNPDGRPKGTTNKTTSQLRETITAWLDNNFESMLSDYEVLNPKERVKVYCDLLQYGLPRLQAVKLETDYDNLTIGQVNTDLQKLSDAQLDAIIQIFKDANQI